MSPAIEHCVMTWEMIREWVGEYLKDMTDEELLVQPAEKRNHAWWIFGHMVLSTDVAQHLTGTPALTPKEWRPLFDEGTFPAATGANYPPKEELMAQFHKNIDVGIEAIKQLTDEDLHDIPTGELPEAAREYFDTKGKIISASAIHLGYHLGQIVTIRKMLGK